MTRFDNVPCARCKARYNNVQAKTIAGAIRKATTSCNGMIRGKEGATATICSQSFLRETKDDE